MQRSHQVVEGEEVIRRQRPPGVDLVGVLGGLEHQEGHSAGESAGEQAGGGVTVARPDPAHPRITSSELNSSSSV